MAVKLIWRVGEKATGRHRSFQKRQWPTAYYGSADGPIAGQLYAVEGDGYAPRIAETTKLIVRVAQYGESGWEWRQLKQRAAGVTDAKNILQAFLNETSSYRHRDYRD